MHLFLKAGRAGKWQKQARQIAFCYHFIFFLFASLAAFTLFNCRPLHLCCSKIPSGCSQESFCLGSGNPSHLPRVVPIFPTSIEAPLFPGGCALGTFFCVCLFISDLAHPMSALASSAHLKKNETKQGVHRAQHLSIRQPFSLPSGDVGVLIRRVGRPLQVLLLNQGFYAHLDHGHAG